jgi:hypothetical protein
MNVEALAIEAIGEIPAGALIELRAPVAPATCHQIAISGEVVADFSSADRARAVAARLARENPSCCLVTPVPERFADLAKQEQARFRGLIASLVNSACN